MGTLINTLMAALSTIVFPPQEEPKVKIADVMLRHEIIQTMEPLYEQPPANCCILN